MQRRGLIVLSLITVAVIAAAVIATQLRSPRSSVDREALFPELKERINEVAEIRVEGLDRGVTLDRKGDSWVIREADDYPALIDRIRQTVVGVSELRIVAGKTSSPELYGRLGVEDPTAKGASSLLLTLKDASGNPVASLIVGKDRHSAAPGDRPGFYVRPPGTDQALLVEGRLDVSVEIRDWFDRELLDIPSERIREIRIQHGDGSVLRLARADASADLAVMDVPEGTELQSDPVLNRMGTMLEGFFVEGARNAANVEFPADAVSVTVSTFDGLVANLSGARIGDVPYVKFAFSYSGPAAAEPAPPAATAPETEEKEKEKKADVAGEVRKLQDTVTGWAFQVPQFKFELLGRRLEDMIKVTAKENTPAAEPEIKGTE